MGDKVQRREGGDKGRYKQGQKKETEERVTGEKKNSQNARCVPK